MTKLHDCIWTSFYADLKAFYNLFFLTARSLIFFNNLGVIVSFDQDLNYAAHLPTSYGSHKARA